MLCVTNIQILFTVAVGVCEMTVLDLKVPLKLINANLILNTLILS